MYQLGRFASPSWTLTSSVILMQINLGPSARYANLIVIHMAKEGISEMVIKQSSGLPQIEEGKDIFMDVDYHKVINRFKLMCDMNPITYKEKAEGKFGIRTPLNGHDHDYDIEIEFHDTATDPFITICLKLISVDPEVYNEGI